MSLKTKFNKKIAIFGGAGPWASAYAHNQLIKLAQWDYGSVDDHDYPSIFHTSEALDGFGASGVEDETIIEEQLTRTFNLYRHWGADIAIIACNSLHKYYQNLTRKFPEIDIVNLPQEGAKVLANRGIKKAAVLCSSSARRDQLHKEALSQYGIEAVITDDAQQARCDQMIETIMAGDDTTQTYRDLRTLTNEFAAKGAQSVIAGCTELSYLAEKSQPALPVVDCLNAAIEEALRKAATEPV